MKKGLIALSAIVLLMSSCKKDDDNNNVTPTTSNLVGTYRMTAATEDGVNVFDNSDASQNYFEACERDDQFKLNADGSTTTVDAGTQCNPTSADTGTWSLTNSNTLVLDGMPLTIESFNGTTLRLTQSILGSTYKATYVKQ